MWLSLFYQYCGSKLHNTGACYSVLLSPYLSLTHTFFSLSTSLFLSLSLSLLLSLLFSLYFSLSQSLSVCTSRRPEALAANGLYANATIAVPMLSIKGVPIVDLGAQRKCSMYVE